MADLQEAGKKLYLSLVQGGADFPRKVYLSLVEGGADFFSVHRHLKVLTLKPNSGGIVIDKDWLDGYTTHIYVIGIENNTCYQIGGIPKNTLLDKGIKRGNLLHVQLCYFHRDHFYNQNDLIREENGLDPMCVENARRLPTYFFTGPELRSRFRELEIYGISLSKLLENRLEVLKNFETNYKHLHNSNPDIRISLDCATQHNEYILNNNLFEDLSFRRVNLDTDKKREFHYLSQKLMEFFVLEGSKDDPCVQWIALQEERILRFQLTSQYRTEADILVFLESNKLLTRSENKKKKLRIEDNLTDQLKAECERLFSLQFPGLELPSRWFSCNICTCLELGLESLSGSRIQVANGRTYFSYKHIADDWLPKALFTYLTLPRAQVNRFWSGSEKRELIATGLKVRKEANSIRSFSSGTVVLPDIEESAHLFPPCAKFLNSRITESHIHLKFNQRKQYSSFLTDAGWDQLTIINHLRTHELKCGVSEQLFETKYKQIAERPFSLDHNGQKRYGRDKKSPTSGWGCKELTKKMGSSDDCYGCPMRFLDHTELASFLVKQYHIDQSHIPEILSLSSQKKYQSACAKAFQVKFNGFLYTGDQPWVPRSPHGNFFHAIRRTAKN